MSRCITTWESERRAESAATAQVNVTVYTFREYLCYQCHGGSTFLFENALGVRLQNIVVKIVSFSRVEAWAMRVRGHRARIVYAWAH